MCRAGWSAVARHPATSRKLLIDSAIAARRAPTVIEGNAGSSSSNPTPSSRPANHNNSGWRRARSRMERQSMRRGTGGGGHGSSDIARNYAVRPVVPILAARRDPAVVALLVEWGSLDDSGSLAESPMGDSRPSHPYVPSGRGPRWIRWEIRRFPDSLPPLAQIRKSLLRDPVSLLRQPR